MDFNEPFKMNGNHLKMPALKNQFILFGSKTKISQNMATSKHVNFNRYMLICLSPILNTILFHFYNLFFFHLSPNFYKNLS